MIALDLCQRHYQVFLIIYQKNLIVISVRIINQLIFQCLEYKKNYQKYYKELIKRFANTYEFCNGDTNKFIFLLRKGVYPCEYMDSWERFNETLPNKKAFYSELHSGDITDNDYVHAQNVFKTLELKSLGDYYDLHVQSDTCLLMYLKALEISAWKHMNLTPLIFCLHQD